MLDIGSDVRRQRKIDEIYLELVGVATPHGRSLSFAAEIPIYVGVSAAERIDGGISDAAVFENTRIIYLRFVPLVYISSQCSVARLKFGFLCRSGARTSPAPSTLHGGVELVPEK